MKARKKIVTIGSGTGSFMLLTGLVNYPVDLSAVVSMADDGGSTGVLRDELGVLPPGDIRQCLVALSPAGNELRELLNYRFDNGGLEGHAFGNIFLSALEKEAGNFLDAVKVAERILNIRGRVLPVTGENAHLVMELESGEKIYGEGAIEASSFQEIGVKEMLYEPTVRANPEVLVSIKTADVIVIGPGTFYSGILPNLILPEVSQAIRESHAKIIFPVNLTNKHGHTSNFAVEDYVERIEGFLGEDRVDVVFVNNENPDERLLGRYREQEGEETLVAVREKTKRNKGQKGDGKSAKYVFGNLIDENAQEVDKTDALVRTRSFIRHNSEKLARAIMDHMV